VPAIGQGTWHLESDPAAGAIAALTRGLDLGMTHIDTAELYGSGKVEAVVGKAIAGRRDDVFLVSKVMPSHASAEGTVRACERSLKYLGTDRLDCYLLHWPGQYPLGDTFGAFERLVEQGKILSFGVSNFDEDELAAALAIAGEGRIACDQVLYHLRERGVEHAVLPFCAERGIALVAYSPFGQAGGFPDLAGPGGAALSGIAAACAERAGRPVTPRQVALAFLTRHEHAFVIPKASRAAHVAENVAAHDLVLEADEVAALEAAFPLGRRRRGVPML
jgi:diketogulonate reductase-like aldo/keto reductase